MRAIFLTPLLILVLFVQAAVGQESVVPTESKLQRAKRIMQEEPKSGVAAQARAEGLSDSSAVDSVWRMFQGLGICLGTFLITVHFWKRHRRKTGVMPSVRRLRVVERLGLGSKHAVALVEVDGRSVLVGMANGSISVVDMEAAAALRILKDFQELQDSETQEPQEGPLQQRATQLRAAMG